MSERMSWQLDGFDDSILDEVEEEEQEEDDGPADMGDQSVT